MKILLRIAVSVILLTVVARAPMGHLGTAYLRAVSFGFGLAFCLAFIFRGR